MDERELEDLISKTALLMGRYQRMCTDMAQQQSQLARVARRLWNVRRAVCDNA
ncbi:hypothetical protein [Stenotrophomonas cyclobalanopsidis]|uniref:hypothetical protein n=1 Tax=Stenotrophomonas cyclobalanopsidis TaxID=2771362 RepID=UPI0034616579